MTGDWWTVKFGPTPLDYTAASWGKNLFAALMWLAKHPDHGLYLGEGWRR